MNILDLWGSLSTGPLSGLSRETRLSLAHVAARLPGVGEKGRAFLDLSSQLAAIEADLAKALRSTVTAENQRDIEQFYRSGLSTLLYEPLPPSYSIDDEALESMKFLGSPQAAFEEVANLYDYFFSSVVDLEPANIVIPEIVSEIAREAFGLPHAAGPTLSIASGAGTTPESDADRRRMVKAFARKLAPVLRRLAKERDALREKAIETIEQLRSVHLSQAEALASSPEPIVPVAFAELLIEGSRERMNSMTQEALGEIEQSTSQAHRMKVVSSILSEKLYWIDKEYGKPFRDALASLKSRHQKWADVRAALAEGPVRVIDLSDNLRRGEMRREIIAGSVQCVIDTHGVKYVRYSPPEASGPPPDFMNWIVDDKAQDSESGGDIEAAEQRRTVAE